MLPGRPCSASSQEALLPAESVFSSTSLPDGAVQFRRPSVAHSPFAGMARAMNAALPAVEAFVMGTLIYVLSQQWYDLLGTYVVRLHPVPYCGYNGTRVCTQV